MATKLNIGELRALIESASIVNLGDKYEKKYSDLFKSSFPNYDFLWSLLIFPATERVEGKISSINMRKDISPRIWDIMALHYSIFMKIIFSYEHLQDTKESKEEQRISAFEDFYTSLASIFDLVEEIFMRLFLLSRECDGDNEVEGELNIWDGATFKSKALGWYENDYFKRVGKFIKDGKPVLWPGIEPSKGTLMRRYLNDDQLWSDYQKLAGPIRNYRNTIVHSILIGKIVLENAHMVPRKTRINDYAHWYQVINSLNDEGTKNRDFIKMNEQMAEDLNLVFGVLDHLWGKPLTDFSQKLLVEKNRTLLGFYDIEIVDDSTSSKAGLETSREYDLEIGFHEASGEFMTTSTSHIPVIELESMYDSEDKDLE